MLEGKKAVRQSFTWTGVMPLVALLLAFALRMYRLDNQSFAFDEGWTSYAIDHSWRTMWGVLAPDNHPPLYYVLVKAFAGLAGYGDFALRFFSVMCSVGLVAGLYALGRRLGGQVMGISAALFAAVVPSFVYYAQEARMYSLLMALAVLSSYSLLRILDRSVHYRWWRMCYVVASSALLYTHYFGVLLLVSHNAFWLLRYLGGLLQVRRKQTRWFFDDHLRGWSVSQAAILAFYLPWLPTAIRQVRIGQGTWWRMPLPASVIVRDIWRFFVLGPRRPAGVPPFGPWLGPVALAGLLALLIGWWHRREAWAFVLAILVLPVALMVLIGSHLPIYTDRYTLVAAPSLALLVGLGISACWEALSTRGLCGVWAWAGQGLAIILLLAVLAAPLPQLYAYYTDETYWREDFRRAARYVMSKVREGDTVVLLGSYQPVMHYYESAVPVVRFPVRGDSVQSESTVVSRLRETVRPGSSVRLVMYSWETVDPQSLVEGQLRAQCELRGEHWQQETGQRPIRVLNFANCNDEFVLEPRQSVDAVWDGQVALWAYHLIDMAPGKRAHVILWWRTLRPPDRDYSVFVHLLDARGNMIVQHDKLPLNAFYPMRAWPPNVDQRDDYLLKIPANANLEGAWLSIGLYDARSRERLSALQEGVPVGDSVHIPVKGAVGESE